LDRKDPALPKIRMVVKHSSRGSIQNLVLSCGLALSMLLGASAERALAQDAAAPAAQPAGSIGPGSLPEGIATSLQLSEDQRGQVRAFVAASKDALLGTDADKLRRARVQLLDPLEKSGVSVAFRLELAGAALPIAEQMVRSEDVSAVINGLKIAGDLATDPAGRLCITKLDDQRVAVRFAAAAALNRLLEAAWREAPAISSVQAQSMVAALGKRLAVEPDPMVPDALVRGMISGFQGEGTDFADARGVALKTLCDSLGQRVRESGKDGLPTEMLRTTIRGAAAVRDLLTSTTARSLVPTQVADAAGFGGDLLTFAKREIKRGAYPSVAPGDDDAARASKVEARAFVVQAASLGETIVFFAQGLSGQTGSPTKMAELLKDASVQNDARFAEDVKAITGPQGVLSKPPFGIAASRFADK
jgi:hypothetical protein